LIGFDGKMIVRQLVFNQITGELTLGEQCVSGNNDTIKIKRIK